MIVGPGDDAAVTTVNGQLVSTADMLVENEDFTRDWLDWYSLGVKAAAQNLADVCAMGASPHGLLVSLALPDATEVEDLEELFQGIVAEATRCGEELGIEVPVIGGDLSSSGLIVIAITALGTLTDDPLTRSGAHIDDEILLAGTVGRAAAGLDLLFAGARTEDPELPEQLRELIRAQLSPRPDYSALTTRPDTSAMIDVSDGVSTDLSRIAEASGVGARIDRALLDDLISPLLPAARFLLGRETGVEEKTEQRALDWVLNGGEDHGFLATSPQFTAAPVGWRRIGQVTAGSGVHLDGETLPASGFSHFGK